MWRTVSRRFLDADGILPEKVRAFRERRGWTHEQMADEVWASPLEVAAWEAGTVRVPNEQAQRMRVIAEDFRARGAALAPGPGRLPACAWADAHAPGLHEILWYEPWVVESNPLVQRHLAECAECRHVTEVRREVRANPPVLEPGASELGVGLPRDLARWRPLVLFGVVPVIATAALIGVSLLAQALEPGPDLWPEILVGVTAFAFAGMRADRHLRRWPYVGGLLAAAVGMLAGLLTWKLRTPGAELGTPEVLVICAVTAAAGVVRGWGRSGADEDDDEAAQLAEAGIPAPAAASLPGDRASLDALDADLAAPADRVRADAERKPVR